VLFKFWFSVLNSGNTCGVPPLPGQSSAKDIFYYFKQWQHPGGRCRHCFINTKESSWWRIAMDEQPATAKIKPF
jgi:hypothetical protein